MKMRTSGVSCVDERLDRVGAHLRSEIDLQDFDALDLGHGSSLLVGSVEGGGG